MRYVGLIYFGLMLLTVMAQGAAMPTVKFTPTVRIFECPAVFQHKSECLAHEKKLEPLKLWLSVEVLDQQMGHWTYQETSPVPASFHVIVLRTKNSNPGEYSVSTEAGVNSSPTPRASSRIEFSENSRPQTFGSASAPYESNGKKYITELRIEDFHGRLPPTP